MAEKKREISKLRGQFSESNLQLLLQSLRSVVIMQNCDIQINIAFPESPEQGGYLTRPNCRGGPGTFISISFPSDIKEILEKIVGKMDNE